MEVSDLDSQERAVQSIEATLERAMESGWVSDAALTSSVAQFKAFWALRENISEAQGAEGKNIKHDIAVPISRVAEFIRETNALIAAAYPGTRMVVFGHLGDGNLHYNVSPPAGETGAAAEAAFMALQDPINLITHDSVARFNGSVSAEHGLGVLRRDEAARYKSPVEIALMKRLKAAFDPKGLMNPGKYLAG
jgi:FAD/FMN-containing dehydrogenase